MEQENKLVIDVPSSTQEEMKEEESSVVHSIERCKIDLGNVFKDRELIQIHQFERYGTNIYPTKKGVALSLSRWLTLDGYAELIEDSIKFPCTQRKSQQRHFDGGVILTVSDRYLPVDIGKYWKPENADKTCPTKRGIQLSCEQSKKLLDGMKVMRDFVPNLDDTVSCYLNEDHQNNWEC